MYCVFTQTLLFFVKEITLKVQFYIVERESATITKRKPDELVNK